MINTRWGRVGCSVEHHAAQLPVRVNLAIAL